MTHENRCSVYDSHPHSLHHRNRIYRFFSRIFSFFVRNRQYYCSRCCNYMDHFRSSSYKDDPELYKSYNCSNVQQPRCGCGNILEPILNPNQIMYNQ